MNIETKHIPLHVLELTDADVERIIADPEKFAEDLAQKVYPIAQSVEKVLDHSILRVTREHIKRSAKAAKKAKTPKKANWATAGYAGHTARNKKAADDKPGFRCRKGCNRTFKRAGNRDNHETSCLGGDPEIGSYQPAAAAE